MQTSTLITILTAIVALASALSAPLLEQLWPGHGTYLFGVLSVAAIVAGVVINAITKQMNNAPATSIIADAPVVPKGTATTPPATDDHPTVISTSSTLLKGN
jgi:hypothetical protein